MKKILIVMLLPFYVYSQGLEFITPDEINTIDRFNISSFGFSGEIPSSYSLKAYVPPVRDQGNTGTCVGFSMGYYAISTMHNVYFKRTNTTEKIVHAFDPLYAYTLNESDCSEGLNMLDAFKIFSIYGGKKSVFYPIDIDCQNPISDDLIDDITPLLTPYELEGFEYIQTYNMNFIKNVKKSISNKYPVIIGANINESLYDVKKNDYRGKATWKPKAEEESDGRHAMCVIGYDDDLNGGSFNIVNSWGNDWGDDGYFWISYDDFYEKIAEAYVIKPYMLDYQDEYSADSYLSFNRNYTHYAGKNNSWSYEGQTNDEGNFDGIGILRTIAKDGTINHSIGLFENDNREGVHLVMSSNGNFSVNFVNDIPSKINEFGFSTQESEFKIQMKKIGFDLDIENISQQEIDELGLNDVDSKWKASKRL